MYRLQQCVCMLRTCFFAVTFATTTTSSTLNTTAYCTENTQNSLGSYGYWDENLLQYPTRSAGCLDAHPGVVGVPYGLTGLCYARSGDMLSVYFSTPPSPVEGTIDLTSTGLQLSNTIGLGFLYPGDMLRETAFSYGAYNVPFSTNITADIIFQSNNTGAHMTIPYNPIAYDTSLGFCKWITTEAWIAELVPGEPTQGQSPIIRTRAASLRTNGAPLCVCRPGSADCDAPCPFVDLSEFQLNYYTDATATVCDSRTEYEVSCI
jgi:hypothetical protein